jgi:hypothetical protein
MCIDDGTELLFPKSYRTLMEDMEEGIVLRQGNRNFQYIANEVGCNSATAAALRVEMRYVRNRHVESEVEFAVPVKVTVKHA